MRRKLVFIVNNATFFASHRLPIAVQAKKQGYQVDLITGQPGNDTLEKLAIQKIIEQGVNHHKVAFKSNGMNLFIELYGLIQLFLITIKIKPNIVHCASPKGVLYGGIVARLIKVPSLVLAITGMGYGFTSAGIKKYSIKRSIIKKIFTSLLGFVYSHENKKIIVQNLDDKLAAESVKSVESRDICLIRGSGVHLSDYKNISMSDKENIIVLPARMLGDKGVLEFYMAAKQLKHLGCEWRFILAGTAKCKNPSVISEKVIEGWVLEGVVEWLGNVDNMLELYSKASIVCLPSYREGMPKALLEAAAAGCAVITTDAIGCRESIKPGISGDLVQVGSFRDLADSIEALINDPLRRKMYGENGQKLAKEFFDINIVINKTIAIYTKLNNSAANV